MRHRFGQVLADHGLGNAHARGNFGVTEAFDAVQYECGPAVGRQIVERLLQPSEPLLRDEDAFRISRILTRKGIVQRISIDFGAEAVSDRYLPLIVDRQIDGDMKRQRAGVVRRAFPTNPVQPEIGFMRQIGGCFPALQTSGQKPQQILREQLGPKG